MNFKERAEALKHVIIADRRYLHQHAELSSEEYETTAYLIKELTALGIPVQSFEDYTGCIATIKGGKPGNATVLLRGDIDALPMQENSGVEFESLHPGVMHSCGHDCHASMLLGAARLLWEKRDELPGTVKLLFQAAEEQFIGSHYYVDKGYLSDVDAAVGIHMWPPTESGKLVIQDGPVMASCDNFTMTIHGTSAHGSTPHLGKDAIVAASSMIMNLQTIASRVNDPLESLVVTVGTIKAGTQFNIISDTAVLEGTVRTHAKETRDMVEAAMRQIMDSTAAAHGCTAELDYCYYDAPLCNEDIALNELARESARKLYGKDILRSTVKAMGSEDFSYIMEHITSSLFLFLGCRDEANGCVYPIHNKKFKINEDVLPIGAAQMAQFAADYLEYRAGGEKK